MSLIASPVLWLMIALGVGIPLVLIAGVRYLAYRLAGRPDSIASPSFDPLELPLPRFASSWQAVRMLVWVGLLGGGVGIIVLRFVYGIGAVTNLSDQFPWGLWIGFDVMSGVALAAGGFVICAAVHLFGLKRFAPLTRPAVLTAFLGYLLVIAALVVDLGRPYNIWRPLVHWQHHSVLWEVGICVATYTTVLFIEFLPVMLEGAHRVQAVARRLPVMPVARMIRKFTVVLAVLAVVLSTLHQSSLGSLWVLVPEKLSPLWYSLYLPVFFFISAVAVGLAMTIVESTLSSRAFKRGLELDLLADLGKYAAVVLVIYLLARFADLIARGAGPLLVQANLQTAFFWLEIGLGVVVPIILFSIRPLRYRPAVLFSAAVLVVVFGVVLNRLNVSWIGLLPYTGPVYFPSWMEILVSFTLVSFGVIAFGLAAKYLPVFPAEAER
ncbi:MAG: Ni/Fe-hydrogenase cytochrome b subunit [Chloroflexi bacterium]|nr:MAG: Ni/Fe-hydrogenase cytochrome b subunit [Chloroflexota bacterium]